MTNYRLKKDAYPFFKEDLATTVGSFQFWKDLKVNASAIEEVEDCVVLYGHRSLGKDLVSSSLSGWSKEGSVFSFEIKFPSTKFKDHDVFTKGFHVREMMDIIQNDINNYYLNFQNPNDSENV